MNHIFVDYENVKSVDPAVLEIESATFTLLLGPQNRALAVEVVQKLIERAAAVELVRLGASGKNAVDFALVYYLGRKVLADPRAHFHLVSKDTGFDPLIEHLKSNAVRVRRHPDFASLIASVSEPKAAPAKRTAPPAAAGAGDAVTRVLDYLRRNVASRPKRRATLIKHLKSNLLKGMSDPEIESVIAGLAASGAFAIDEKGAVTYHLGEQK